MQFIFSWYLVLCSALRNTVLTKLREIWWLNLLWYSQRQIPFSVPLKWRNLFGPKDKVSSYDKLDLRSGVRFLLLFVLRDVILLKLDLRKRTLLLDDLPNGKLSVYKNAPYIQKLDTTSKNQFIPRNFVIRPKKFLHCKGKKMWSVFGWD